MDLISEEVLLTEEVTVSSEEALQVIKSDPDALAAVAMPEVFEYCWPPVFTSIWFWLLEIVHKKRDFSKLAIGLPRGFGKTTLVKLFILYCILFTDRKFILILSATKELAMNIIADVFDMLNEPNIVALFGKWDHGAEIDQKHLKKFGFRGRDIIVAGIGAEGTVRGLNLKNARPDVMVFEDVQSREDADSEPVSDKLYKWILGTAMKAKSPKGCMTLFIANMYPTPHSILKKLIKNSKWIKWVAGGILLNKQNQFESLWPELQPLEQLMEEFENDFESGHPEIFHAEVLNDPNANINTKIDISKIPAYPWEDSDIHTGNFVVIDPATEKANADDVSVGYFEVHDARACMMDLEAEIMSPTTCIWKALNFCMAYNCRLIVVEGNAYQSTLAFWFKTIMEQVGIEGIEVVCIYSGKNSKTSRIIKMFTQLVPSKESPQALPEILIHDRVRSKVLNQISAFAPLRTDNVDGILDLLTYAPRVLVEHAEYIQNSTVIEEQGWRAVEMPDEVQTSPF